jgi:integral membrane sensor domain MASE1
MVPKDEDRPKPGLGELPDSALGSGRAWQDAAAKRASRPVPLGTRFARRAPSGLRGSALPLVWLVAGILASYLYMDTALLSTVLIPYRDPVPALPVPLFPVQATLLCVLLLTPRRRWWVYLLTFCAIHVARSEWIGLPRWYTLLSTGADIVEPLVGAFLFRCLNPRFTQFTRLREVGTYVGCVVLAAMLGAAVGATARAFRGYPFWTSWQGWRKRSGPP